MIPDVIGSKEARMDQQGPLPPRPGELPPPSSEQGKQGGQPIDQPFQPRPAPQPDPPKTM
jgi:hypothetical protein